MVTICPLLFPSIFGRNSFTVYACEVVLTAMVVSINFSLLTSSFFPVTIPALIIRIVTSPNLSKALAVAFLTSFNTVTLQIDCNSLSALIQDLLLNLLRVVEIQIRNSDFRTPSEFQGHLTTDNRTSSCDENMLVFD